MLLVRGAMGFHGLCFLLLEEAMKPQAMTRRKKREEGLESVDHLDVADEKRRGFPWTLCFILLEEDHKGPSDGGQEEFLIEKRSPNPHLCFQN